MLEYFHSMRCYNEVLLLTSERELLEAEVFKHNCNKLYPMLYCITIL